jgi:raffinose/stachyose/melibiose transport system permease protein
MNRKQLTKQLRLIPIYLFLLLGAFSMLYPYVWMVASPFKSTEDFYRSGMSLIPKQFGLHVWHFIFVEIRDVYPIFQFIMNSIIITLGAVFFCIGSSLLGGYALARKPVPGKKGIVLMILATLMLPTTALIIPLYFVAHMLGVLDSYWGVTFVLSVHPLPFLIIYRFFRELSSEYEDAAKVDGASDLRTLWSIVIPLAMPAVMCAGLIAFIFSWSAFIEPLIVTTTARWLTLPVSLLFFQVSQLGSYNQELIGIALITTIPVVVVFLFTQRNVFEGITGGIKS